MTIKERMAEIDGKVAELKGLIAEMPSLKEMIDQLADVKNLHD